MDERGSHNQRVLVGCGALLCLLALVGGALLFRAVSQERLAARYPGAIPVSSHSNYSGLPSHFRWDEAYYTPDDFRSVYNWYSVTFDLGAESRALERCILLDGADRQLLATRYTTVLLCGTPTGQLIYVTRSTSLGR